RMRLVVCGGIIPGMALELRTPLCRELGIEHPIFSVGFGMSAVPELVAAVSNAGGCGVLGGSSAALPTDELGRWVRRVRELTDRPFGFNMIIAGLYDADTTDEDWDWLRERIGLALDGGASVLVFFWDNPEAFVEDAHRRGAKVFLQVGSVAEAAEAVASGVDAVIGQGV